MHWLVLVGGRKKASGSCKILGMEDGNHGGKLRKYQCCPMVSQSKAKTRRRLAKGLALTATDDDDDQDQDDDADEFVDDSDFDDADDDDDDDDDDDGSHFDLHLDTDQNGHAPFYSPACTVIETNDYLDDDDFVPDAPGIPRKPTTTTTKKSSQFN